MTDVFAIGTLCLPGWALARWLCGPRGGLESLALSVAFGRLLLAGTSLLATSVQLPGLVRVFGLAAWLVAFGTGAWLLWRGRLRLPRPSELLPAALVIAVALLLTQAVVARTPGTGPDGSWIFQGRHPTADSLIYHGIVGQLIAHGLPLREPLIAGAATSTHELFFGSLAGLWLVHGVPTLDVTFRLRPLLDMGALAVTVLALGRALGLSRVAAPGATLLLLLGGGLTLPLFRIAEELGFPLRTMELWSYGNAFLLPFNPAAPGLQTGAAALLLLARPGAKPARSAAAAGALIGFTAGLKVAVFAGLLPALGLAALRAGRQRPALRRAFGAALLASLPLVIWTAVAALALRTTESPLPLPCPGCLARYALASAWGNPWQATVIFEPAGSAAFLDPRAWLETLPAGLLWFGLTLGVRLAAAPLLLRPWRRSDGRPRPPREDAGSKAARDDADTQAPRDDVLRILGAWIAIGALLTLGFHTPPHFPNAGQFAWCAGFLLWLPFAATLEGDWHAGRRIRVILLLALALSSGPAWLWQQGYEAPVVQRLDPEVRTLVEAAGRATTPDDLVLEPSLLVESGFPTPVAWLAYRPVWASQGGMLRYLPEAEGQRRRAQLETVFLSPDPEAAARVLRETGATLVVAPAGLPTALRSGHDVEVVFANRSGRLLRPLPRPPAALP